MSSDEEYMESDSDLEQEHQVLDDDQHLEAMNSYLSDIFEESEEKSLQQALPPS